MNGAIALDSVKTITALKSNNTRMICRSQYRFLNLMNSQNSLRSDWFAMESP